MDIQMQIVTELDGYKKVIDGAKQVAENWKPKIEVDPAWKKVKLGDVCETSSGGTPLKSKPEYYKGGTIPWLRSGEVAQGFITKSELFITDKGLKNSSAKLFPVNTVLVAMYGATAGQVGILKFESSTNQAVCGVLPNKDFIPEFLFQALRDQKERMISLAGGGAQPNISQGVVRDLEVPLPPLEVQRQIVDKLEAERVAIEAATKLIPIFEQKIKDRLAKLWG
jgi:restriction endonuclease S subunit